MRQFAAQVIAMIRIDLVRLAVEPIDMRAGMDTLLARVVQVFVTEQIGLMPYG